jgi:hypothetical protein
MFSSNLIPYLLQNAGLSSNCQMNSSPFDPPAAIVFSESGENEHENSSPYTLAIPYGGLF